MGLFSIDLPEQPQGWPYFMEPVTDKERLILRQLEQVGQQMVTMAASLAGITARLEELERRGQDDLR